MAIIGRIVRQHVEMTAHLWTRRRRAALSAEYDRTDLGRIDARLRGHIAGLVAAGAEAWPPTLQQFEDYPDPGEAFVLMLLALILGDAGHLGEAIGRIFAAGPEAATAAGATADWCGTERLKPHLDGWLHAADPDLNQLALMVLFRHRADPGERLARLVDHPSAPVAIAAIRLAAALGRTDLSTRIERRAGSEANGLAVEVVRALARLTGHPTWRNRLRHDALAQKGSTELADWAICLFPLAEARRWLLGITDSDLALRQLGVFRQEADAGLILAAMEDADRAAAAGAAFRDHVQIDFNDTSVFTASAKDLSPAFEGRDDGPWPVADRARAIWQDVREGRIAADFISMRRRKLDAIQRAGADRSAPLDRWEAPVAYPAWS